MNRLIKAKENENENSITDICAMGKNITLR